MKAYRVMTGYTTDFYGNITNQQIARYFTDKAKAEEFYKTGGYTMERTYITTVYKDGYVSEMATGAQWYEREKARAEETAKNDKIEKITVEIVKENHNMYTFEEITIE